MKIEISANPRKEQGTSASRRLRHAGRIPGVVYGGGKDAVAIDLDHKQIYFLLKNEDVPRFHSVPGHRRQEGKTLLLRDYQMHSVKQQVLHIDFQRVSATEKIHMKVPLHFAGAENSPGVKLSHGVASHIVTEAEVSCLPKNLPEFIEVDLSNLQAGHSVHLSEIKLPKSVEFVDLIHGDDKAVATIVVPRGAKEAAAETAAE